MKYFFPILILLCSLEAKAQNSLSGKVVDKATHEPIIGATIYVAELRNGVATNPEGSYTLQKLPKGQFTVEVRLLGYQSIHEKLSINGNQTKDFVLEASTVLADEVVVTGASAVTLVKESPIPIVTYSRAQWLQSSSTNLVDAVGKLPGMSQITTGAGLSKPVIRGLGFNRVITMHDGVRQEDNQWGEEHSIHVDEFSIDRYEIIKGAGSLMYGSDGLGGVMSLLSPRPVELGSIRGQVLTNYQSNNGLYGISGMVEGNTKGLVWRGRVSHKNTGNYSNRYDGTVYGSNYNELDYNGMVGINRKWGYSHVYLSRFKQTINIVDGVRDSLGRFMKAIRVNDTLSGFATVPEAELRGRAINPASHQLLSNYKVSSNNFFKLGNSSLSVVLSYAQNHRQEFANVFAPGIPDLYFFLQTSYYDLKYYLPIVGGWETTIGSNGMYQTMTNRGSQTLYPNFSLLDNGLFVFTKQKFNRFHVSGGVRVDRRELSIEKLYVDEQGRFITTPTGAVAQRFAGLDKTYKNITGSLGAVYDLTDKLALKFNVARGFRAPSVPEISSNGEHAGTFRYEIGNPNQKSETTFQSDLGVVFENKSIYLNAALFQNTIQHYSYSEKVLNQAGGDSIVNPARPVLTYRYTQGNAMLYGGEAILTIHPEQARWFNFTGSYSLVRSINYSAKNDSAKYLPFLPAPRWLAQLKLTRKKVGTFLANAYLTVEGEFYQAQNQVLLAYGTETPTPGYALVNLGLGADIVNKDKITLFSVYVNGQNLLDEAYQSHQSRFKYLETNKITGRRGVYNMGRNISVKVVVPINFRR